MQWMMRLNGYVIGLLVLTLCFVGIKLLYLSRSVAMRALALRLGFQFREGEPHLLYLPKGHRPLPTSFQVRGNPWNNITRAWNFIEGEKGGIRVLIFDSTIGSGKGKGIYITFIAVRTDENPFGNKGSDEKIAHSNGWTALYRFRFWQIPWTLSIQSIEAYVDNLRT
jgi:hypothetical protein